MLKHAAPLTLLTLLLASCAQTPQPQSSGQRFKVMGMGEIVVGEAAGIQPQNLTQSALQLKSLGNTMVDYNGYRYISTRYQVRNASSAGVASNTAKTNLTLIAGETANTLGNTAIRAIKKADGSAANPSLASQILPAGALNSGPVLASDQSFQVFTSSEIAPLAGATGLLNAFPYGFVVDRVGGGRTLPANPTASDYQGTVTVSVKVPLQTPLSDTPTSFTLAVLYAEDSVTQVSESSEEKNLGNSGLGARVTAAGATRVNVFPGSTYSGTTRTLCKVPISSAATPSYLINTSNNTPTAFAPGISTLAVNTSAVTVTFGPCVDVSPTLSGSTPQNQLVIQAFQTGKRLTAFNSFNAGTFSQSNNMWSYTPTSPFKPGEEVEFTTLDASFTASVHRFRIGTTAEGAAGYNTKTDYTGGSGEGVALGDVNGDGKLDALVANLGSNTLSVMLGNGNGTFQAKTDYTTGGSPESVALGDVNGDGKLDVLVPNLYSDTLSVLLGNGNGTFQAKTDYTTGSGPVGAALGDVNGDGKLDAIVGNINTNTMSVFLGNGNGTFQAKTDYTTGNGPVFLALGDVNADGKLDAVLPNINTNTLSVLLGNGNGTFQTKTEYTTGNAPYMVALGDVNADGKLDAVVANNGNTMSVLLGNGNGTFQTKTDYTTGSGPTGAALGDINGDGKLDAIIANNNTNTMSVLLGNGNGTFQTKTDYTTGNAPYMVALGDVNGDGKLDAVVTTSVTTLMSVLVKK